MTRIEPERLEQAAVWRARLAESPESHAGEFSAWLAQDPGNRAAWRRVQGPWDVLGEQARAPGVIRLRRAALAHAHDAIRSKIPSPKRLRRLVLSAAAASAVLAAIAFFFWQQSRPVIFRTGFGQRRVVTLVDGSQITLDLRSEVTVRYTADARTLTLVHGQARFDVAHDITRPLSVSAEGHKVVATGTAFNVDLLGPRLLVTLIRGHVVVLPQSAPTIPWRAASHLAPDLAGIDLDPGEQLVMSSSAAPRVRRVNVEWVMAWERGEIIFDNQPLARVVQRMNRYQPRKIAVGDDRTASLRISGVFREGHLDDFVSTIAAYLPVRVNERSDGDVVLTYRSTPLTGKLGS